MLSFRKLLAIVIGSLFLSIGINFFLMPFKILDGGIIGISLIINYLTNAGVGLLMFLCSIPIFVLTWFYYRGILFNSLYGLLVSSIVIAMLEQYHYHFLYYIELSPFTSAVLGGTCVGTGFGIMLRYETSTGGMDLLAKYIAKVVSINVGVLIFILDGVIVSLGGLLLSAETFFLSVVSITAGGVATSLCTMKKAF